MKYLNINVIKHTQDLYAEDNNMRMKEIKDLNKQRDLPCT